jgi:hypothetical protein
MEQTDKASMLDEVIDYLKQLQAQVQVMSRMSSMMMPMAMPQLQMSVMAQMAHMAQMAQMAQSMMNMGSLAQQGYAGLTTPPMIPPFVPMSWDPTATSASTAAAGAGAGTSVGVVGTDRAPQPGGAVPDAFSAFLACQAQQNGQVRCVSYVVRAVQATTCKPTSKKCAWHGESVRAAATGQHGGVQQDGGAVPEDEPAAAARPAQQFTQTVRRSMCSCSLLYILSFAWKYAAQLGPVPIISWALVQISKKGLAILFRTRLQRLQLRRQFLRMRKWCRINQQV